MAVARATPCSFAAKLGFLLALAFFAFAGFAADGDPQAIPALTARVTDLTGTLSAEQKQALENELIALEQRKGSQLGILIVPTTQPEDIAQYGIRVGEAWKLGRKGTDDGAILLVAKDDHRVRIEVGRGLEGAIPDAAAARIIREYITPKFRAGDFYGGVHDATGWLSKLIDGEPLPPPLTGGNGGQRGSDHGIDFFNAALFTLFAIIFARTFFGGMPSPLRGGLVGLVGAGAGWLTSAAWMPFVIGAGILGLILGILGGAAGRFANRGGWGGIPSGTWGGGGLGGGGFGGGGFGGGGFGGGGGGFGGGGASGSW